ncbi:uncharacterized protein LOC141686201 [Apium graveolens]|uniref:uncharacterized protein LOC141686201 n=1 Tax=Apium graveolens TaxID=4045 RepID=UPI003D79470B
MASGSKFSFSDTQNPLLLHPSDNPLSISVTKLQGATDYRSWKRSMEIQLSSKRKLGFVEGTKVRSTTDQTEAIQWDTCNSMVMSWLHNNISDSIKKSVLFITSASEVWNQLQIRFQLTNGSHKYKLNRELFALKQNGSTVVEYFTSLSSVWEELEFMNLLPSVTTLSVDVTTLLKAISTQKEEAKLFQFLNGLDDVYAGQRSQLLLMNPLPSVDMACASIQQEESQRLVLTNNLSYDTDLSAMFSKTSINVIKPPICTACGGKGHTNERCWNIVGYLKWHHRNLLYQPPKNSPAPNKWSNSRNSFQPKKHTAANISVWTSASEPLQQPIVFLP